ncbi:MAG TPA: coenzyme F420-0:L-glutamate ligase [Nitrososphaeraceae archaeon]|jgi:coenzyme F420-0:L-glutamate ligase / coenzyme F420-1:gamma-L-glutamate ligase|nr:coenzyme F420-0:L-glutamate ligase [Nitrososphaeraceae archaeon]
MAIKTFCKLARMRYRQSKRHARASRLEAYALWIPPKIRPFDLCEAITMTDFQFQDNDIIIVSSKFVSISEGSVAKLDRVKVTHKAELIAKKFHLDEKLAELVLRESEHIYGGIPGFLLCKKNGMLCPNAGIDKSNIPKGYAVLYPRMPFESAERLRRDLWNRMGLEIFVVISDSRLMPGRKGTTGIAISHSGFEPVIDERGDEDLFGNILRVTMRAVADGLASIGVTIMGESRESTPVVVIRGFQVKKTDRPMTWQDLAIDPLEDIYLRSFKSK